MSRCRAELHIDDNIGETLKANVRSLRSDGLGTSFIAFSIKSQEYDFDREELRHNSEDIDIFVYKPETLRTFLRDALAQLDMVAPEEPDLEVELQEHDDIDEWWDNNGLIVVPSKVIGTLYERLEFKNMCAQGTFNDDDGFGYAARNVGEHLMIYNGEKIYPSSIVGGKELPVGTQRVMWFNK